MGKGMLPFERRGDGGEAGRDVTGEFVSGPKPLTVTELVGRIKEALLDAFGRPVVVVGEISNFKRHSSGHLYFSLKDAGATIDAVMFRQLASAVRFDVADGLEVVAEGRVDVYEKQGRLQFYVERLTPRGAGALELAFQQLKAKLQADGLFDPARKKPLPRFPRAIGVITSPTGAAVRDIARTLRRRWPAARVYLVGVRVQGEQAAGEIAEAVALLDARAAELEIDTIIVGRGGGSLEDLWAFNEEAVARAIFAARTPIVSGVGHEVDFSIADFVADVRAATPTAAAELAVPDAAELRRHVRVLSGRLVRRLGERLAAGAAALEGVLRSVVFRDPAWRIRSARQDLAGLVSRAQIALDKVRRVGQQRLHDARARLIEQHPLRLLERARARAGKLARDLAWALGGRAKRAGDQLAARATRLIAVDPRHRTKLARQRLDALARQLDAMSYRAVLRRGFTVTRTGKEIVRSAAQVAAGDVLETELIDGKVQSRVEPGGDARPRRAPRRPARTGPSDAPLFDGATQDDRRAEDDV